jgi:hypothetical protein
MNGRLNEKIAIVIGAGSSGPGWGNGKAAAVLSARERAKVFAVDIRSDAADETRSIIRQEGGDAVSFGADVSKAEEVEALVQKCLDIYGRIDVLLNNVGILAVGGPEELDGAASWKQLPGLRTMEDIKSALRRLAASSGSMDLPLRLLDGPSLPQQDHRPPLACAAKQQRISQGRALDKLAGLLVVPRKLRANG